MIMANNRTALSHAICNGIRKINTTDKCFDFCIKWSSSNNYFRPQTEIPFKVEGIETLELSFDGVAEKAMEIEIGSIWLE